MALKSAMMRRAPSIVSDARFLMFTLPSVCVLHRVSLLLFFFSKFEFYEFEFVDVFFSYIVFECVSKNYDRLSFNCIEYRERYSEISSLLLLLLSSLIWHAFGVKLRRGRSLGGLKGIAY